MNSQVKSELASLKSHVTASFFFFFQTDNILFYSNYLMKLNYFNVNYLLFMNL